MSKSICVVGAARLDLLVRVAALAGPGETALVEAVSEAPSGRGLRQAVGASRLGAQVSLVGCVGDDGRAAELRSVLSAAGVDLSHLRSREEQPSGLGFVQLLPDGTSAATVFPGANATLGVEEIEAAAKEIRSADLLLVQGEAPAAALARAIETAQGSTPVVFHAARPTDLDTHALKDVGLLVATREEAGLLLSEDPGDVGPAGLARRLACLGPERVVIALGHEGAIHFNGSEVKTQEGFDLSTVDARGAEDAFVAALAVRLAEGARLKDAVRMAVAAAALAGSVSGALEGLPTREQVEELLAS